jgi:triosephosphate isomerase
VTRRPLVVGNWKMNLTPDEAAALAERIGGADLPVGVDVAVAPPALSMSVVARALENTGVALVAQNVHPQPAGAYTGELSAEMFRSIGVAYALVGHSERRAMFGEGDLLVADKVRACLRAGLLPIVCVGETLAERDAGAANAVVERQLAAATAGVPRDQLPALIVAYEPVWAIGTGRVATPDQAGDMHRGIRAWLRLAHGAAAADAVRILYGGSVKASNAASLLALPDVDGALVGGASLVADEFLAIAAAAR